MAVSAVFAIAACSQEPTEYKADVKDESGGQMIVQDADATGVPVDLPDTPMTPVPPSEAANGTAADQ